MRQADHLPSLPSSPGHTDPPFSPTIPHKPPVFGKGLALPQGYRGGTCCGRAVDTQPGWSRASGHRKSHCVLASSRCAGAGAERAPCACGMQEVPTTAQPHPGSRKAVAVVTGGSVGCPGMGAQRGWRWQVGKLGQCTDVLLPSKTFASLRLSRRQKQHRGWGVV